MWGASATCAIWRSTVSLLGLLRLAVLAVVMTILLRVVVNSSWVWGDTSTMAQVAMVGGQFSSRAHP